jgi:4-diphosphocytidyl-2-C-methyl-D-erythritol kinase
MISFPPCKINLGLHITAKRIDGYHDLVTCFYPVPWTDMLEIIPSDNLTFTCSGLPVPGEVEDNLCLKAYHLLKKDFNIAPVHIHLHKIIPMGAGLGGGSSDAAWALRTLNQMLNLEVSNLLLQKYAAQLGSDCAFFIQNQPVIGRRRGELLATTSVNLKNKFLVLVKPGIHISTAEAYAGVKPAKPPIDLQQILEQYPIEQWKKFVKNDFEESVFRKFPLIAKVKNALYDSGALYASMSGSGSAIFGIFSGPVDLEEKFQGMVYWSGRI